MEFMANALESSTEYSIDGCLREGGSSAMATILVVDDRPTNREFLKTLLGHQSHQVLEAIDGAEALALVKSARPDLVISDIRMPTMDGYEFVHRLRADPIIADIPVIVNTAHYLDREA